LQIIKVFPGISFHTAGAKAFIQVAAKADIANLIRDNGMVDYNHGGQR
jgi:hypothetical protein